MNNDGPLPPMPDRQTGEPRPPKAPIKKTSTDKPVPWNAKKVPQPPEGEGPVLEWDYADSRTYRWVFGVTAVLLMVFLSVKGALDSSDWLWYADWRMWLTVAILAGLMALTGRTMRISAGADWFMDRTAFIKTYELSSVTMGKSWDQGEVKFFDRHGNRLDVELGSLRLNGKLWDLVYNGIRHSVLNGAEVNVMAVQRLQLYEVLEMRERRFDRPS